MSDVPSLPIGEAAVRQRATDESFRRGQDYEAGGAVLSLVQRGDTLAAEVAGSEPEPYRVRVTFDPGGVVGASCSCPYEWGGWCKHIVAALLAALHRPGEVQQRPLLEDLLAALSRDDLVALVEGLVAARPELVEVVEAHLDLSRPGVPAPASAAGESPRPNRVPIDAEELRREMREALRGRTRRRDDYGYGYAGSLIEGAGDALNRARAFTRAGDAPTALAMLDALTAEYVREAERASDDDGELGYSFEEISNGWAEAILSADLSPAEREEVAVELDDWAAELSNYGLDDVLDTAIGAAAQGWDHPAIRALLAGERPPEDVESAHGFLLNPTLLALRLGILERQGRIDEYLNLARASGQVRFYLTMLARLGRTDEAVGKASELLANPADALAVAQALRDHGDLQEALRIGERGLTLDGPKADLAIWVRDLASGLGERDRALAAAVVAFQVAPGLAAYDAVRELAGESWPERRAALLDNLRHRRFGYSDVRGAVDVFLREGLVGDAIAAIELEMGSSYYSSHSDELVETVLQAAIPSQPDWVISTAKGRAEGIANAGRSKEYVVAARWLGYAREAYRAAGREAEWSAYLADLIAQHRRKTSLRPMLEALQK